MAKVVPKKELANFFSIKMSSESGDSSARKDVSSESGFKIFNAGILALKTLASDMSL